MSVSPNPIDGAIVMADGQLLPMNGHDASAAETEPDPDAPPSAVPVAMTSGRQLSAARSG